MIAPQDLVRFRENLPFAANGTLSTEEQSWLQGFLLRHPQYQAELQQAQRERAHSLGLVSLQSEQQGLERLLRELDWAKPDASPSAAPSPKVQPAAAGDARVQARGWPHWRYLACGLLGAAAAALWFSWSAGERSAQGQNQGQAQTEPPWLHRGERNDCMAGQGIRITLGPAQSWASVVSLLRSLQLQIVNGPTDEGEIWVLASADAPLSQTLALLRGHPAVEQALPGPVQRPTGACQP